MQIAFTLGREERIVILDRLDTGELDEFFVARLKKSERDAARVNFELAEPAFEALAKALVRAYQESSGHEQDEIQFVIQSIEATAHPVGDVEEELTRRPEPGTPAHAIAVEVERLVKERGAETLEEAQAIVNEVQAAYNNRPQEELGGFTPYQMMRLFAEDWHSPSSGIQLRSDLPLESVESVEIFINTRLLLRMLKEAGGTKATARGNLNTKFVKAYAERMVFLRPEHRDMTFAYKQTWYEDRTVFLADTRFVAQTAGLLSLRKGVFKVTKKGERLLADGEAGALYALMFDTFFQKFNLACLDGAPEAPTLQASMPYTLAKLHLHAQDWQGEEALTGQLFLPRVIDELAETPHHWESAVRAAADRRVFLPLKRFGLLKWRRDESPDRPYTEEMRVTPLFNEFFTFDLDPPAEG